MSITKITNSKDAFVPLQKEEVEAQLANAACKTIQDITLDTNRRLHGYKSDLKLLSDGIFYAHDYFAALSEMQQNPRIEFFRNRNSFLHGYASSKHFEMEKNKASITGFKVNCFVLKKGILPSTALSALRNGPTILGCGEICQIADYTAIESVLGEEKFNALLAADSTTPLIIGNSQLQNNPLGRFRLYLVKKEPELSHLKKGDVLYFANDARYLHKHIQGSAPGWNAYCVDQTKGNPKFCAFGFSTETLNYKEIESLAINEFNLPPNSLECLTSATKDKLFQYFGQERLFNASQMKEFQISVPDFKENGGGQLTLGSQLNVELITTLANSTVEKAQTLFRNERTLEKSRDISGNQKERFGC